MNYTSARYDAPYTPGSGRAAAGGMAQHSGVNANGQGGIHSASSSSSSMGGETSSGGSSVNMAGVGSHAHAHASANASSSSNGSFGGLRQRDYDSSGDFDQHLRYPGSNSRNNAAQAGPSLRALAMHQQQQQQQQQQMVYQPYQHRRAQNSDDFHAHPQYAGYSGRETSNYQSRPDDILTPSTARIDRSRGRETDYGDGDTSFDFLLSPGLAPVGPISTSSSTSLSPLQSMGLPQQQQQQPPLSSSILSPSTTPSRPTFGRSQTAMPAPSGSGRAFQAPQPYREPVQQAIYANDYAQPPSLNSSVGPSGSGHVQQGSTGQSSRDHTPAPPITSAALLNIVRNICAEQMPGGGSTSMSSAMSRSQSANATARLQQSHNLPAHMRNISTGSNKSDDDAGVPMGQNPSGLLPPSHPGMSRTASSKNVMDTSQGSSGSLLTIDLTHNRIAEVPTEVIDQLAGNIGRYVLSSCDSLASAD